MPLLATYETRSNTLWEVKGSTEALQNTNDKHLARITEAKGLKLSHSEVEGLNKFLFSLVQEAATHKDDKKKRLKKSELAEVFWQEVNRLHPTLRTENNNEKTIDYSQYLQTVQNQLEQELISPLARTLSLAETKDSLSLIFPPTISGQLAKETLKNTPARSLLAAGKKAMIVLAELGGGKTYLLNLLMRDAIASYETSDIDTNVNPIPVFLTAKDWKQRFTSITEGIWKELKDQSLRISQEVVEQEIEQGKYILLIDGIDEVIQDAAGLYSELGRMARRDLIPIIVTCRSERYHQELKAQFGVCTIDYLTETQINQYIISVLGTTHSNFYRGLNTSLQDLVKRPLFLQMTVQLAKLSPKGNLPKNRANLYSKYVELMLTDWQAHKTLTPTVSQEIKERILAKYAERQFRTSGSEQVFDEIIVNETVIDDPKTVRTELYASGLIQRTSTGPNFYHSSFQEYYYALSISYKSDDEVLAFISANHKDSVYVEIFIFLSGFLKDTERQALLLDFLERHNLELYGKCLRARFTRNEQLQNDWTTENKYEYLNQLRKSYQSIIESHFSSIKEFFAPWQGFQQDGLETQQLAIEGNVELESLKINYQLKLLGPEAAQEEYVKVTPYMVQGFFLQRNGPGPNNPPVPMPVSVLNDSTGQGYYYLPFKEWGIDSAREAAVDKIKSELERFFKAIPIFPSDDLLLRFEYLNQKLEYLKNAIALNCQLSLYFTAENLKLPQPLDDLKQVLSEIIEKAPVQLGMEAGITSLIEDVDWLSACLEEHDTSTDLYVLETPSDPDYSVVDNAHKWQHWEEDLLVERIKKFYLFFQFSYRHMVKRFFPTLSNSLPLYNVGPVQFYCKIKKPSRAEIEPFVTIRWMPVDDEADLTPIVEVVANDEPRTTHFETGDVLSKLQQMGRNTILPFYNKSIPMSHFLQTGKGILLKEAYRQLQEDFQTFFNNWDK